MLYLYLLWYVVGFLSAGSLPLLYIYFTEYYDTNKATGGWICSINMAANHLFGEYLGDPANTKRWPNVVVIMARRQRRRPMITTTLGQRFVFAGTVGAHLGDGG